MPKAPLQVKTEGLPQLITSFADFLRVYGGYLPEEPWKETRYLAYAVEGFFNNGGQRLYIKRVVDSQNAQKATLTLNNGFVTRLSEDTASQQSARNVVKLMSLRGISVGSQLRFTERIAGQNESQVRTVTAYSARQSRVTLNEPLTWQYTVAGCQVTFSAGVVPPDSGTPSLDVTASSEGKWGESLEVIVSDMDGTIGVAAAAPVKTSLRELALAFATNGPNQGTEVDLADVSKLQVGDLVEFSTGGATPQTEQRSISVIGHIIRWADALQNNYSGASSTIHRLTALAFSASGPNQGTETTLADVSQLQVGDVVEFSTGGATPQTEQRSISAIDSDSSTIRWTDALQNNYSGAGSTIHRLTALAFSTSGPNQGTETTLANVSQLQVGDVVEFSTGGATPQTEQRNISAIGDIIRWADALQNNYSGAGSTIHRITGLRRDAANPIVLVESVAGFQAGDLVRLAQGETTQLVQIATDGVDVSNRQITLNTSTLTIENNYLAGDSFVLATAGRTGSDQLNLSSTNNFYERAVIEVDDGTDKDYYTVTQIEGRSLTVSPALVRSVGSGTVVRVVEFNLSVSDRTTTEAFSNLSLDPDAPNFVETMVNLRSRLIRVTNRESTRVLPFNIPRTTNGATANLTGGNDGNPPTADDYRGSDEGPGKRTGIKALADIDNISIIAVPGIGDASVQAELINQCEQLKDRFAVLDPFPDSIIGSNNEETDIEMQRGNHDTFYGAMYYPWLRIRDPLYGDAPNGRLVPPSGHLIGIYARVDTEQGVQKAPANEVIRGITGVEIKLSDREQDILNPKNINVIRDFRDNNRGIRVWGSRCLTSDNAWKYVPVRRLFIFLEESLDEGLQWVVFEPNGEALWARVRRTIAGFLRTLWLSGALAGVTEEEAFFVKCDRTTMTEDDIANGRLIILVGAAPLRPAEFVIVRVSQKTLEASS